MENKELTATKEVVIFLNKKFPQCFLLEGESKPLKINILQDLIEALANEIKTGKISKVQLRRALYVYTNNWRYLYGCKENAKRVDLNGNEGEIVTAEQAEYAKQKLQASKKEVNEKRKALKAQRKKKFQGKPQGRFQGKPRPKLLPMTYEDLVKLEKGCFLRFKLNNRIQKGKFLAIQGDCARVELFNGLNMNINIRDLLK